MLRITIYHCNNISRVNPESHTELWSIKDLGMLVTFIRILNLVLFSVLYVYQVECAMCHL